MPTLPKHLRPRWRYLAIGIECWPDTTLTRREFQRNLWYSAQNLLGDVGSARADLRVISFTYRDGIGEAIVRVRRGQVESARAALACVSEIDRDPIGVHVRGVSGTVRRCEEKYLGRRREPPEERTVAYRGAQSPAVVRGDRIDVRTDGTFAGATHLDVE